ncbi:hypothetical protein [Eleftheria terrae]|uniref:hypothetical protein n=1 Tax=Eleftheria terrae TaxID=1597781 RepID=UPI00263B982E|nr:hypothetical protein [Eleftheria terrae]WKB55759.1 hypothetical protein N7L95_27085 [Eleftheria terrae]
MLEFVITTMTTPKAAGRAAETVYLVDAHAVVQIDLEGRELRVASSRDNDLFLKALVGAGLLPLEMDV